MSQDGPILPGATLGLFGGGQLGRMFIQAAQAMGYQVHLYADDADGPAAQVANQVTVADYQDFDQIRAFARSVQAITFEFENIPVTAVEAAAASAPVRPAASVLRVTQNRIREKSTLREAGLPVTPFRAVRSREELSQAVAEFCLPTILKTAESGYDGRGQARISAPEDVERAWNRLACDELILEKAIPFDCEISVVAARNPHGEIALYGPFENAHRNHILDVSTCPARVAEDVRHEAMRIAQQVMITLDVIGVLCVEFFVGPGSQILINELAPRPHNSGHLTIDAFVTSQFEQQLRAVCGLPLGSTRQHGPAAMANLMGDLWNQGTPDWDRALRSPEVKLHLYGKHEPRPGRKMGHLTATADDVADAAQRVRDARQALDREP